MSQPRCRFCDAALTETFADLGMSPPSNSYVPPERLGAMERFYPLHARVCTECWLVQVEEFETPAEIFSDYAYFSSYSDSWLEHCRAYVGMISERLTLGEGSFVVEIASNDGYLLQYFVERGVKVLGVEPAANVAEAAIGRGVPTEVAFFGVETAKRLRDVHGPADLLVGNNVLAHVPDINDFVGGLAALLAGGGTVTMEFPHLLRLIEQNQFDTIYHEHFSYLSVLTVKRIFAAHGLKLFDVEQLPTHGGSLRIYAAHAADPRGEQPGLREVEQLEREAKLDDVETYRRFEQQVRATKRALLRFLIDAKDAGKTVVGYGAAAKGNTLLNYCGVRADMLDFVADRSPHKQGRCLPGTHIPIVAPERIFERKPDYVLILPWNLRDEITAQLAGVREWGGRFVAPIPTTEVIE